jgi:hypothetical protein
MANPQGKYYQVYLRPQPGITFEALRARMDLCLDWFKYGENLWIVYSTVSPIVLEARLNPYVRPSGRLLICEIRKETLRGWMDQSFWDWTKEIRK